MRRKKMPIPPQFLRVGFTLAMFLGGIAGYATAVHEFPVFLGCFVAPVFFAALGVLIDYYLYDRGLGDE